MGGHDWTEGLQHLGCIKLNTTQGSDQRTQCYLLQIGGQGDSSQTLSLHGVNTGSFYKVDLRVGPGSVCTH